MNAIIKQFEEGFIKQATANGVDEYFLRGYLKEAQDITDYFAEVITEAEKVSGDPYFRAKLAAEILLSANVPEMQKEAAGFLDSIGQMGSGLKGAFTSGFDQLGKLTGDNGMGGLIAGGGGGALLGLLLARQLNLPPWLGMLLFGIGGAGIGNMIAGSGKTKAPEYNPINDPKWLSGTIFDRQYKKGPVDPSTQFFTPPKKPVSSDPAAAAYGLGTEPESTPDVAPPQDDPAAAAYGLGTPTANPQGGGTNAPASNPVSTNTPAMTPPSTNAPVTPPPQTGATNAPVGPTTAGIGQRGVKTQLPPQLRQMFS